MQKKAVALLSGGLDSTLAIKTMLDQGVDITAVNFISPFCLCNRRSGGCCNEASRAAKIFGIKLKIMPTDENYIRLVKNPKFGYGRNMNPCLDCRIYMHRLARKYMEQIGASFLVTGEVVGQRPMSQRKDTLRIIEKESGLEGLVVRPLSAQLLPPTMPEKEGVIDRAKLLSISGRGRKPQIELARNSGINDYPCAAGGCLLTDANFARRLKELFAHQDLPSYRDLRLLRLGRHFRVRPELKLVVGRNEEENKSLQQLRGHEYALVSPLDFAGPAILVCGPSEDGAIEVAASLIFAYSKKNDGAGFSVEVLKGEAREKIMAFPEAFPQEIEKWKI